jgi:hypothetical protein
MIADNITGNLPSQFAYSAANTSGIREHSNETVKYRDSNINVGGPIRKDKVWWYFSYRNQKTSVGQPNFIGPISGTLFDTKLWNPSGKTTYQLSKNNKLIGYYQWGQKVQPNRLPSSTNSYTSLESTLFQKSGSWIYKGEWNGTLSNSMYVEARYGVFGYYFPLVANSDSTDHEVVNAQISQYFGADQKEQTDRQRRQATGSMTYFKDGLLGGSHNFKFGGELLMETGWFGYTQAYGGGVRENLNSSGLPNTVIMSAPTATHVGSLGDGPNGNLLSVSKLNTLDAFITDQFTIKRTTLNIGLRWDHYDVYTPEQSQLAFTFPSGLAIQAQTFPEQHYLKWNGVVPRLGISHDLMGDGKTVLKANWGLYKFNPGVGVAAQANPNQDLKTITYQWIDRNSNLHYEKGEEGTVTANALSGSVFVDPNTKQPDSMQATLYLERQLTEGVGLRTGFVYFSVNDQINTFQLSRPASAYTVPFTFVDRGVDGTLGTADDRNLTYYGIPNSQLGAATQTVTNGNQDGKYKTFEISVNKRQSHNYSLGAGYSYTWKHDFPLSFPNTPNGPFDYDYRDVSFKLNAMYNAPYGINISPVFRYQGGTNFARTLSPSAPAACLCTFSAARGGTLTNTTVYADNYGDNKQDDIKVFDVRIEKSQNLGNGVRVRIFGDVFNVLNSYAAETITVSTGPSYLQPTAILGPRTFRLGARLIW